MWIRRKAAWTALLAAAILLPQCSHPAAVQPPVMPGTYAYSTTTGHDVRVFDLDRQRDMGTLRGLDDPTFSERIGLQTRGDAVFAWVRGSDPRSGGSVHVFRAGRLDADAVWPLAESELTMIAHVSDGIVYFTSWTSIRAYSAAGTLLWQLAGRDFVGASPSGGDVYAIDHRSVLERYHFDGKGLALMTRSPLTDTAALRLPGIVDARVSSYETDVQSGSGIVRVAYPACGVVRFSAAADPQHVVSAGIDTDRIAEGAASGPHGTIDLVTSRCRRLGVWKLERYGTDGTLERTFAMLPRTLGYRMAYARTPVERRALRRR